MIGQWCAFAVLNSFDQNKAEGGSYSYLLTVEVFTGIPIN